MTEQAHLPVWRRSWVHRGLAYLFIVLLAAGGFWEVRQRQEFDQRRAYDICVDAREAIYEAVDELAAEQVTVNFDYVVTDDPAIRAVLDQIEVGAPTADGEGPRTPSEIIRDGMPLEECLDYLP